MIIKYANGRIEKICNNSRYALKYYPKKVVCNLEKLMYNLAAYDNLDQFRKLNVLKKYNIHELCGDKKGIISLRVDYSYRMGLKLLIKNINDQDVIEILEVTNHYED